MPPRTSNYTRGERQGMSEDNFPACESRPRRGMPSAGSRSLRFHKGTAEKRQTRSGSLRLPRLIETRRNPPLRRLLERVGDLDQARLAAGAARERDAVG